MMIKIFSKNFKPMLLRNVHNLSKTETNKFSNHAQSIFRQNFNSRTEEQLNVQITHELNASQAYLAMSNFFGRTDVAQNGSSAFFRAMSSEERDHALELIDYQNMRGGRVKLNSVAAPKDEFGSLLNAIEESLLIERGNSMALMELVHVAESDGDIVTSDYICSKFLKEQMSALQSLGKILTRLKRFEQTGLGEYLVDLELEREYGATASSRPKERNEQNERNRNV